MNYLGVRDCKRRFPVGSGYHFCMCRYHQARRFTALKQRLKNDVEPRWRTKMRKEE